MPRLATFTIGAQEPEIDDEVEDILRGLTPYKIHPSLLNLEMAQTQGGYGTVWRGTLIGIAANQIPDEAKGRIERDGAFGEDCFIMEGLKETRHTILSETDVAVKKLRLVEASKASEVRRRFVRETDVWSTLYHPNITRFLGFHLDLDKDAAWLVSFWNPYGNLDDYLSRESPSLHEAMNILEDIARGLTYLHSRSPPIVHGDIKPANVMMKENGEIELCDFGLAEILDDEDTNRTTSRFRGSIQWSSPEVLSGVRHSTASDIWAFGVLSYQVMNDGRLPFHEKRLDGPTYMRYILEDQLPTVIDHLIRRHSALASLVRSCWSIEPLERPNAESCQQQLHSSNSDFLEAQAEPLERVMMVTADVVNISLGLVVWIAGGLRSRTWNTGPSYLAGMQFLYVSGALGVCILVRTPWGQDQLHNRAWLKAKRAFNGERTFGWWAGLLGYLCILVVFHGLGVMWAVLMPMIFGSRPHNVSQSS